MNRIKLPIGILILLIAVACEREDSEPSGTSTDSGKVLVLCEGAFLGNSASISIYDDDERTVQNNAFESANGYSPGDVLNSVSEFDGKLFMVLNNSGKIEVVDKQTLQAESPITGLISPRSIILASANKGYVSNLYSSLIQIVDPITKTITGSVDVHGWSEGMILVGTDLFIAKSNGDKVMVVDTETDMLVDSIAVTAGPVNMELDVNGNIWLSTNGNFGATSARIHRIDPSSRMVTGTFDIPAPHSYTIKLTMNGDRDQVYILNNGIYTMFIGDSSIDTDPLIDSGISFYGLGVDASTGDIYTSNAGNFVSSGNVARYSSSGILVDEFEVGIAPNGFIFR